MNGFIDIQFKDLDVLREMVDIGKGFGSQYCSFSISQSRIEIIGSDLSSISSVYVYVSYEISRNVSSSDVPLQMRSFSIPHSIQNTDVVCFKVVMELPDFYKVHCVGASMKTFNERIKISANNQGELKLETGHAMFNMITCFNNCINHMDLVEVLEYDNSKFVTINVDSTHFVKFFSVVTEDFYVNFTEKDDLKVKLILPAKL
ncbi:9944_t:CDS:2 [Gigaspora margarita]|uniref:9944_t:CDS:1 n=1 Tax=Gigaspora margarita TaxID=4874 RepID=A0ABM8VX57_GIGMA|nr:9944_t:CDS:2 [Gigaspora margarita]